MNAKEQAHEIIEKFECKPHCHANWEFAKYCALICINDEVKLLKRIQNEQHSDNFFTLEIEILELEEVKNEINKL